MAADLTMTSPSGGPIPVVGDIVPSAPVLRWSSRATSIAEIERELARIWAGPRLVTAVAGVEERHIAARTSVMNLVVVARRPEIGERCAATISQLTPGQDRNRPVLEGAVICTRRS